MSRQLLLLVGLIHLLCLVDLVIMRLTCLGFIDAAGLGTAPMDGEKKTFFPLSHGPLHVFITAAYLWESRLVTPQTIHSLVFHPVGVENADAKSFDNLFHCQANTDLSVSSTPR